jgi:hypothetical protein
MLLLADETPRIHQHRRSRVRLRRHIAINKQYLRGAAPKRSVSNVLETFRHNSAGHARAMWEEVTGDYRESVPIEGDGPTGPRPRGRWDVNVNRSFGKQGFGQFC